MGQIESCIKQISREHRAHLRYASVITAKPRASRRSDSLHKALKLKLIRKDRRERKTFSCCGRKKRLSDPPGAIQLYLIKLRNQVKISPKVCVEVHPQSHVANDEAKRIVPKDNTVIHIQPLYIITEEGEHTRESRLDDPPI